MILHKETSPHELKLKIRDMSIQFGGNKNLKIYGTLDCPSGKRMKRENRVFFQNEKDAQNEGYRPCGHCMKDKYKEWISLKH